MKLSHIFIHFETLIKFAGSIVNTGPVVLVILFGKSLLP